jgi:Flp pilus assembly protein TadG
MYCHRRFWRLVGAGDSRGQAVVWLFVMISILLAVSVLAVDVGYALVARGQLQNVADATALAATRYIGDLYEGMTYEQQLSYTFSSADIIAVAKTLALKNPTAGDPVVLKDVDVLIGKWNAETRTFYDVGILTQPNAVRVTARRDASANGPVPTFFANIFGINTVNVAATATAAISGQSTAGPGKLPVPVGISKAWFKPNSCDQVIQFSPTGTLTGCAGWNTFTDPKVNDSELRKLLAGLTNGTMQSPETIAGITMFNFIGGNMSNPTFAAFENLFDTMRVKNDGILDADLDPDTWTTAVAVYGWPDCSNPNKMITIVGFATAKIYAVEGAPAKTIFAQVKCDFVTAGRSGGGNYGTMGSIPGLVQ